MDHPVLVSMKLQPEPRARRRFESENKNNTAGPPAGAGATVPLSLDFKLNGGFNGPVDDISFVRSLINNFPVPQPRANSTQAPPDARSHLKPEPHVHSRMALPGPRVTRRPRPARIAVWSTKKK
jgi:hypothetical protein